MLVFENKGLLDTRAITTFGVSAKAKDNAIGYFGTGLKYAIAILLREGCEIEIYTGDQQILFYSQPGDFRNKEFQFINMTIKSGLEAETVQELPFTTELGKNWELWQAFRELYCNCLDENGQTFYAPEKTFSARAGGESWTTIFVSGLDRIWKERHQIVLASSPVYYCNSSKVEIHAGRSRYLYFQGIKVHEYSDEMKHTYNFVSGITLTEDRTISDIWQANQRIAECLSQCSKEELLEDLFHPGVREHKLDFDYVHKQPSEAFKKALYGAKHREPREINLSAIKLQSKFEPKKPLDYPQIELDEMNREKFNKAVLFLKDMNVDVTEYPITFHEALSEEGTMGEADMLHNTIKITHLAFTMGTKQVVSTLLEEYIHLKHRYNDSSRAMQSFLFDSWLAAEERVQGVSL
jgi:hypothetical protein